MVNVYKWPPVAAIARDWDVRDPVAVSRSLITGGEFVSTAQRRRRVAAVEVSSRFSPYQAGAGYMKALKRLLKGGVNLVRLDYAQFNWGCLDVTQDQRAGDAVSWASPPEPFDWTLPPAPFTWFSGTVLTFTVVTEAGFPAVRVTGLPPSALVALPGEYVTVFTLVTDLSGAAYMVLSPSFSDAEGVAIVRLVDAPEPGARISIGGRDTGVFRAVQMPRTMESAAGDWTYSWQFEEVFEDEGRGPFTEVNPWI